MSTLLAASCVVTIAACSGNPEGVVAGSAAVSQSCSGSSCGVLPRIARAPAVSASTVPPNGDVNPYGIAFVPGDFPSGGTIGAGDIVVANFNNAENLQGTGTTVVRVNAGGAPSVFFADGSAPGFSTALGVISAGFAFLGNVPSSDGSGVCNDLDTDAGQGALTIIDRAGHMVQRLTSATLLDGPWDLTVSDQVTTALVFVANVKSGTVTRVNVAVAAGGLTVVSQTQVASGYPHRCDPNAFVVGPTGLAYDSEADVLYVASPADNAIFAIAGAGSASGDLGKGTLVGEDNTHFHGPLGLVRAQNGDLVSAQGDAVNPDKAHPSEIVEVTATGSFVSQFSIDHAAGSAFGVALESGAAGSRFAAVDDGKNVLDVWHLH